MRIGLFVPCYVDMMFPEVGIATLQLLEKLGLNVGYQLNQTCCGQPMSNSGDQVNAAAAERLFVDNFAEFDYIVGPAGSCAKRSVVISMASSRRRRSDMYASEPTSWSIFSTMYSRLQSGSTLISFT